MGNKTVYCLDCEKDFQKALQKHSFEILSGSLGYRRGSGKFIRLKEPPNECDVIIFNLTNPACFDRTDWGPDGKNDNYRCTIVDKVNKSMYLTLTGGAYTGHKKYPKFRLIQESQIDSNRFRFHYAHLQKAISVGGIDCIYYLNPIFMFPSLYYVPKWTGFAFETETTKSRKWVINKDVTKICKSLGEIGKGELKLCSPIEFKLLELQPYSYKEMKLVKTDLLINNVNECLAAIVKFGRGFVYFLPPFTDSVKATVKLINDILPNFKQSFHEWEQQKIKETKVAVQTSQKLTMVGELLPLSMFNNTRGYIIKVVTQINGCYVNEFYDACAAMLRRLIETLIIEIYETSGGLDEIKSQREIIQLEKLIEKIFNDPKVHISRNVRKTLNQIKVLGDTGSHNRKVNLKKDNIDDLKTELKIAIEELMQNIKFR